MEFEFEIEIKGFPVFRHSVFTQTGIIDDRAVIRMEYRACRESMYRNPHKYYPSGTEVWAKRFRCRANNITYKKLVDDSSVFWTRKDNWTPWTEWSPMPPGGKEERYND